MSTPRSIGVTDLKARLKDALAERDQALLDLAKERELTNAIRLLGVSRDEPEPLPYPPSAGVGPTPLRYLMVDRANEQLKTVLGPMQRYARRLAELLLKRSR